MNRVSNRHQLRLIAEVPVTPLLDLVLILLFVFLVAAPLLKQDAALGSPAPSGDKAPAATVTLAIGADASVKLDGASMAMTELPAALAKLAAGKPDTGVIVQVPRDLPVHRLVDVMGLLKVAKIRHTAVTATEASQR